MNWQKKTLNAVLIGLCGVCGVASYYSGKDVAIEELEANKAFFPLMDANYNRGLVSEASTVIDKRQGDNVRRLVTGGEDYSIYGDLADSSNFGKREGDIISLNGTRHYLHSENGAFSYSTELNPKTYTGNIVDLLKDVPNEELAEVAKLIK